MTRGPRRRRTPAESRRNQLNCFYSEDDGTGFLGNQPLACARKAAVVCPAKTRRRRERDETKLERVVRERQWKGPGKSTTTA
jgi:hypothetical protein